MTYDVSLDLKPAKGSKSVQQHPLAVNDDKDFDSKSEMAGAAKSVRIQGTNGSKSQREAAHAVKKSKQRSSQDDQPVKQEKYES